jgi:hypothetical protein
VEIAIFRLPGVEVNVNTDESIAVPSLLVAK